MARVAKPRELSFYIDLDADGVPHISNMTFCSATMSQSWGQTFAGVIDLNSDGAPYVAVYIVDRYSSLVEIHKSPFTGGDITTEVNPKVYDEVVEALSNQQEAPAIEEELPPEDVVDDELVEDDELVDTEDLEEDDFEEVDDDDAAEDEEDWDEEDDEDEDEE
jgi:hypothetical protein